NGVVDRAALAIGVFVGAHAELYDRQVVGSRFRRRPQLPRIRADKVLDRAGAPDRRGAVGVLGTCLQVLQRQQRALTPGVLRPSVVAFGPLRRIGVPQRGAQRLGIVGLGDRLHHLLDQLAVSPLNKAGHQLGYDRRELGADRDLDAFSPPSPHAGLAA